MHQGLPADMPVLLMQTQAHAAEAVLKRRAAEAIQKAESETARASESAARADESAACAEERRMQLAVLMDALETLQAGTPGESTNTGTHTQCT